MELLERYKLESKPTELYLAHRVLGIVVNLLLMFQSQQRSYNTLISNLRAEVLPRTAKT